MKTAFVFLCFVAAVFAFDQTLCGTYPQYTINTVSTITTSSANLMLDLSLMVPGSNQTWQVGPFGSQNGAQGPFALRTTMWAPNANDNVELWWGDNYPDGAHGNFTATTSPGDMPIYGYLKVRVTRGMTNTSGAGWINFCMPPVSYSNGNRAPCYGPAMGRNYDQGSCPKTGFLRDGALCNLAGCAAGTIYYGGNVGVKCWDGLWAWQSGSLNGLRCGAICDAANLLTDLNVSSPYSNLNCMTGDSSCTVNCQTPSNMSGTTGVACAGGKWSFTSFNCFANCGSLNFTTDVLTGYTQGNCTGGMKYGDSCMGGCDTANNYYPVANMPHFYCYSNGQLSLSGGGCAKACTTAPPFIGKDATVYQDPNSAAFDGNTSTFDSFFNSAFQNLGAPMVIEKIRWYTGPNGSYFNGASFSGNYYGLPVVIFTIPTSAIQQPNTWQEQVVQGAGRGPWTGFTITLASPAVFDLYEIDLRHTNGNLTGPSTISGTNPVFSGDVVTMPCAAGSSYSNANAGQPQAQCADGMWMWSNPQDCVTYDWHVDDWSMFPCQGECQEVTYPYGQQTRPVDCYYSVNNWTVADRNCPQNTRPAWSQACVPQCPAAPTINAVEAFNNSVSISLTYANLTSGNSTGVVSMIGVTVQSPASYADKIKSWTFSVDEIMNGKIVIRGLENGVTYTFGVQTVFGPNSTPDFQERVSMKAVTAAVTPMDTLSCFFNCGNNGMCHMGSCMCYPGFVTGNHTLMNKGDLECDQGTTLTITGVSPNLTLEYGASLNFNTTMLYPDGVSFGNAVVYVLPASCKDNINMFCEAVGWTMWVPSGVNGSDMNMITFTPGAQMTLGSQYIIRVWWNPKLWADSPAFTAVDIPCANPCQNGGICYRGMCMCTSAFMGTYCETAKDACQQKNLWCSAQGTCTNGMCSCQYGFGGDMCQYPPGCNLRCKNNSTMPIDVNGANAARCTQCQCLAGWTGNDCGSCSLKCANGGSPNQWCTGCTCPAFYTGEGCQYPYNSATALVDVSYTSAMFSNKTVADMYRWLLDNELSNFVANTYVNSLEQSGTQTKVTLWFYTDPSALNSRDYFKSIVDDRSSDLYLQHYTRAFVPGSVQYSTIVKSSAQMIVPSIFTLIVALFLLWN